MNLLVFSKEIDLLETNFGKKITKEDLTKIFNAEKVEKRLKKKLGSKK